MQKLWWRDRQDTKREGLATPVPQQGSGRHVFHPCIWMLCRTWATSPWAPCGNRAGSCWPGTATPSQPWHSWAAEDDRGPLQPWQIKNIDKPLLHYGHYLDFPALQSSLKQSKGRSLFQKVIPTSHSSDQKTPSYISKQCAFLHCSGIKPLPVVFLPCYPMESYPWGTEAYKSAVVTWQSKLTYLCCKCKLVLCSEAKLWVKANLVLQQTIKSSNPVSKKKSGLWLAGNWQGETKWWRDEVNLRFLSTSQILLYKQPFPNWAAVLKKKKRNPWLTTHLNTRSSFYFLRTISSISQ